MGDFSERRHAEFIGQTSDRDIFQEKIELKSC
jgi:hypothetical protein